MELLTYINMNYLENQKLIMNAHLWIAKDSFGQLLTQLPSFVNIRLKNTDTKPPTDFELNDFTAPFQEIVDTYGTPRYGEVNPGLFAISFFPFLFGVMFGDIGHGGVLLALGIYLCYNQPLKKSLPIINNMRYLVLMMGVFAFFAGWIYNDFFSIPLNIFGSCYTEEGDTEGYVEKIEGCVYPFGLDPRWIQASNELNYFNSFKMKFAVIIGIFQMSIGKRYLMQPSF
jgi:V-type H+-transporting ATPase subunit a